MTQTNNNYNITEIRADFEFKKKDSIHYQLNSVIEAGEITANGYEIKTNTKLKSNNQEPAELQTMLMHSYESEEFELVTTVS